jgi:2-polyprenyl-6-methoxyphenol hydroxylase-like FAD-dependent oxidoreductase
MTALALSRVRMDVLVLERSDDTGRTGAALSAQGDLLEKLTGRDDAILRDAMPSGVQTWFTIHAALRAAVERDRRIRVHQQTSVCDVGQDGAAAWASTSDGKTFHADIVVGADGHRSVVRRRVCPDKPDAQFAGYMIWLGIVEESAIGPQRDWPTSLAILDARGYTLLGYPLPGKDGRFRPGHRQLGWAWYNASRNDVLRAKSCVVGNVVHHTLRAPDVPAATHKELAREAKAIWPSPWREAVIDCVERQAVIGTPIAEYVPDKLANGRLVLVGDAAHVPTPMTGNGFSASFKDAQALAKCISQGGPAPAFELALQAYERLRLEEVRKLVQGGQTFSRSFSGQSR